MKLIKNFLFLSGGEIASKLATFAAVAYLARVAGPEGYGYLEFAGAVMLCAGLIVDQGFDPYGAREIAKSPRETEGLVSEIILARVFLALAAYASVIVFAFLLHRPPIVTQLLLIYGLSLLASPFLLRWVFQGHSMMGTAAAVQVVRQLTYAAVVFVFIRFASQIWIAGIAELAGVISAVIYGVWIYRRRFGEAIRVRLSLSRRLFVEGVPIGLSQLFWMVRMYGATVIVGIIATPEDVGYFGAAMRIFIALHTFVWLYYFNLLPSLSRAWQAKDATFSTLIARSMRLVVWTCVLMGFGWALLARPIMAVLYGAAFASAGVTLQWLAGVFVAAALSGHYRYGLIASGYQNIEMSISLFGSIVAAVLIPVGYTYGGPGGAAAGLLVAEIVVWLGAWAWSRKRLDLVGHARFFVWPLVAASVSVGVLKIFSSTSAAILFLLVAGLVIFLALVLDSEIRDLARQAAAGMRLWYRTMTAKKAAGAAR